MAEVFRARKEGPRLFARDENGGHFSREIAIKLILPHLSSEDSFRELFSREAQLASLLDHPNIVAIQDYGTLDGTDYIVMEYIRGMDLRELLRCLPRGQKLPMAESISILYRISRGLAYAHEIRTEDAPDGIIHRDLSPHNILISKEGEIKIADFGIARAVKEDATRTTGFRGKLSYMSPEQAEGRPLDHRSDLFSLGTISYQLLTGEHPFTRGSDPATIRAVQEGDFPPMSDSMGVPAPLKDMVNCLLEVRPDSRLSTAHDAAAGFEPFLEPLSDINLGRRVSHQRTEPSGRHGGSTTAATLPRPKRRLGPVAVLAGLAVVVSLWFIADPPGIDKDLLPEASRSRIVESAPMAPPDKPAQLLSAPVVIRTSPPGARITLNSRDVGRSPVSIPSDADGKARIVEARLYGYAPVADDLKTGMSSTVKILVLTPLPKADVWIGAKPWAEVYFRGDLVDYTPVVVPDVPVGNRTFTLKNDTLGVTREVTLNVQTGTENIINEDLNADIR